MFPPSIRKPSRCCPESATMISPRTSRTAAARPFLVWIIVSAMLTLFAGCKREKRDFHVDSPMAATVKSMSMPTVQPGTGQPPHHIKNPYEDNAWAVNEGKTLYSRYNCSGCHANGGGGMGPALMDNRWIYGGHSEQIFATIVEGRPNGMPSFRGLIPENQVWQLTAYVRSMSGLIGETVAPGRNDTMNQGAPAENSRHNAAPEQSFVPPSTVQP